MTVAIRIGLRGGGAAAPARSRRCCPRSRLALVAAAPAARRCTRAWPFLLAGLLAPGCSQILFTLSMREAGASRTSVAVGDGAAVRGRDRARLPRRAARAAARARRARDRRRRRSRSRASATGRGTCGSPASSSRSARRCCFAVRDNIVRALHAHASPETAAAATLLAGTLVALAWARRLPSRGELRGFAPAGILFGLSYVCLFEAYFHGRVIGRLAARRDGVPVGRRPRGARARRERGRRAAARRSARCSSSPAGSLIGVSR